MKVRNVNGTRQDPCRCGSWLEHWKKFSSRDIPAFCAEIGCMNRPEAGALVQKDNLADFGWYIIPVCKKHNVSVAELMISELAVLVSADVNLTCGK